MMVVGFQHSVGIHVYVEYISNDRLLVKASEVS